MESLTCGAGGSVLLVTFSFRKGRCGEMTKKAR